MVTVADTSVTWDGFDWWRLEHQLSRQITVFIYAADQYCTLDVQVTEIIRPV